MYVSERVQQQLEAAHDKLESGLHYKKKDFIMEAIRTYRLWETAPGIADKLIRAYTGLCMVDPSKSLTYLQEAQRIRPDDPAVLNNLGYIHHKQLGDYEKSIDYYERCLQVDPKYETAYLGILDVFSCLRMTKLEEEYMNKAIQECPESAELWNSYGLFLSHGDVDNIKEPLKEAMKAYEKALQFKAEKSVFSKILLNKGHLLSIQGLCDEALKHYIEAIRQDPSHALAYGNILLNLHYMTSANSPGMKAVSEAFQVALDDVSLPKAIDRVHKRLMHTLHGEQINRNPMPAWHWREDGKITVAFMGADFVGHAVACFIGGVITELAKFEDVHIVYYSNFILDAGTVNGLPCHEYRCIKDVDKTVVYDAMVNKDKINVLIDTSGHTAGNRIDVLAMRPAPVCLTWCGYPNDLGLSFVKRITDNFTEKGTDYAGSTLVLPRVFLAYGPPDLYFTLPFKDWTRYKADGMITLGCFAKLAKINKGVIKTWCSILNAYPNTRLVLKSRYFSEDNVKKTWKGHFGKLAPRVLLLKGTKGSDEHMSLFKIIDLHLDTWPYSGTTITTESLFMNVPVLTMCPPQSGHVTRVSGSIIESIGLEKELIATSTADYIRRVGTLIPQLAHLNVRERLMKSPFMDSADLANEILVQIKCLAPDAPVQEHVGLNAP